MLLCNSGVAVAAVLSEADAENPSAGVAAAPSDAVAGVLSVPGTAGPIVAVAADPCMSGVCSRLGLDCGMHVERGPARIMPGRVEECVCESAGGRGVTLCGDASMGWSELNV